MSDPLSVGVKSAGADTATNIPHVSASSGAAQTPNRSATRPPPSWLSAAAAACEEEVTLIVVSPTGNKDPLKIRLTDDVSTLRALVTQMYDSADWTTQTDRREDRKDYSDWTDEDTGFAEVIALEKKPHEQAIAPASWRNPRTWLEWNDKRGKLRLMCGVYHLADGKPLSYYDMVDGSVIHPLYERHGDAIDAGTKMLSDPDWYKQQGQQARALANQASAYFSYLTSGRQEAARGESEASSRSANQVPSTTGTASTSKLTQYFIWPGPLVDQTPKLQTQPVIDGQL